MGGAVSASISARVKQCEVFSFQFSVFRRRNHAVTRLALLTEHWLLNTILAFLLAALPLVAQPAVDMLQFLDGSTLHGSLAGLDPAKGIRWQDERVAVEREAGKVLDLAA